MPTVTARPGPLNRAIQSSKLTFRKIEQASGRRVSRATVNNLTRIPGYSIRLDKAEAIAEVLGLPVGELFVHHDLAPLRNDA